MDVGGRERHKGADAGGGCDEGHKLGVEDLDGVCIAGEEGVDDFLQDGKGVLGVGVLSAFKLLTDGVRATISTIVPYSR